MYRLIVIIAILIVDNPIATKADRVIVVIPPGQIRRIPTRPVRASMSTTNPYNGIRALTINNRIPQNHNDNHEIVHRPHVTLSNVYGRGYYGSYDKMKTGLVPLINRNRYPVEPIGKQSRQPSSANIIYHSLTSSPATYQPNPIDNNDSYLTGQSTRQIVQTSEKKPQESFASVDPSSTQSSTATKIGPIIVKPIIGTSLSSEPVKSSSNVVTKLSPSFGVGKAGIVLRDTVILDDYEKKIAEFTKSWPKLSAFPSALGSASSFFHGSSLDQPTASTGLGRNSYENYYRVNSIGRQGYAVKEDIDEPPIDFRTMPIITSPLHLHPTNPTTVSLYRSVFG